MNKRDDTGFSLLELSLVLVVLGVLLGGLMRPLLSNREQLMQRRAEQQLTEARESLLGFAGRHGHLPCPATESSGGASAEGGTGCSDYRGYLPVVELGLSGNLDGRGLLLDPWSKPVRYSLSASDSDADGEADFAVAGGMQKAGLSRLAGDLKVSHWRGGDCNSLQLRASHVVAVLYSDAKIAYSSKAERRNQSMGSHYASGAFSQSTDCGFDDHVQWLSDSALFSQLLRAQQLP